MSNTTTTQLQITEKWVKPEIVVLSVNTETLGATAGSDDGGALS